MLNTVGNCVHVCIHGARNTAKPRGITLPRVGGELSFHVEISPLVDLEQPQHASKNEKGRPSRLGQQIRWAWCCVRHLRMRSKLSVVNNGRVAVQRRRAAKDPGSLSEGAESTSTDCAEPARGRGAALEGLAESPHNRPRLLHTPREGASVEREF